MNLKELQVIKDAIASGDMSKLDELLTKPAKKAAKKTVAKKAAVKQTKAKKVAPPVVTPKFGNGTNTFNPAEYSKLPDVQEAAKFDKKNKAPVSKRVVRSTLIDAKCAKCQRTYKVSSKLAGEKYVCDNCIG